jgi:flavorubredoxin
MQPVEIKPGITWIGVNDRCTELFEGLWSIKREGVSYHSYLIRDQKNAIIDLSKEMLLGEYFTQLGTLIELDQLDYVVINHMEPDHSGALRGLLKVAPNVQLIGTAKTREMLREFYGITENIHVVADGETLNLGSHTLRFIHTPFVHWPETMMTYDESARVVFSCDGFGSYGALNGCIFDDPSVPVDWYADQALRYYSNIISTFSKPVKNAIAKLEQLPIDVIAPSHGLVWHNHPERIVDLYRKWSALATEPAEPGVTLLFASMYGNTEALMEVVAQGIADAGVPLNVFDVSNIHISYILPSLWTNRGVMIGAPTYEGGIFPGMGKVLEMASVKHIYNRKSARFGSHAWSGGAEKDFIHFAEILKWDVFGSMEFTGSPSREELHKGRAFGEAFANSLK